MARQKCLQLCSPYARIAPDTLAGAAGAWTSCAGECKYGSQRQEQQQDKEDEMQHAERIGRATQDFHCTTLLHHVSPCLCCKALGLFDLHNSQQQAIIGAIGVKVVQLKLHATIRCHSRDCAQPQLAIFAGQAHARKAAIQVVLYQHITRVGSAQHALLRQHLELKVEADTVCG